MHVQTLVPLRIVIGAIGITTVVSLALAQILVTVIALSLLIVTLAALMKVVNEGDG